MRCQKQQPTVLLPKVAWKEKGKHERPSCPNIWLEIANKFIYFVIVLILNITLLLQVYGCFGKFAKEPTYVETKLVPQQKALVPAMTFCPNSPGYKEDVLKVVLYLFLF